MAFGAVVMVAIMTAVMAAVVVSVIAIVVSASVSVSVSVFGSMAGFGRFESEFAFFRAVVFVWRLGAWCSLFPGFCVHGGIPILLLHLLVAVLYSCWLLS